VSDCVVDASALASWLLPDERDIGWAALFEDADRRWIAPAHLPAEIGNVFLQCVRRQRLKAVEIPGLQTLVARLEITIEPTAFGSAWRGSSDLAERHTLTLYDAFYLEMALRRGLPLATGDRALIRAAGVEGVEVRRPNPQ